jgi:hypothetical protein
MTDLTGDLVHDLLRQREVPVADGLTERELAAVERRFGIAFAADHRVMLGTALPIGRGWPDWRDGDPDDLEERLHRPIEGVLFDVEEGVFWYPSWGDRPATMAEAMRVARRALADVPLLAPVYAHRYLPAVGGPAGHPVLSVMQTDVIAFSADLATYLRGERGSAPAEAVTVTFWRDLL